MDNLGVPFDGRWGSSKLIWRQKSRMVARLAFILRPDSSRGNFRVGSGQDPGTGAGLEERFPYVCRIDRMIRCGVL